LEDRCGQIQIHLRNAQTFSVLPEEVRTVQGNGLALMQRYADLIIVDLYEIDGLRRTVVVGSHNVVSAPEVYAALNDCLRADNPVATQTALDAKRLTTRRAVEGLHAATDIAPHLAARPHEGFLKNQLREPAGKKLERAWQILQPVRGEVLFMAPQYSGSKEMEPLSSLPFTYRLLLTIIVVREWSIFEKRRDDNIKAIISYAQLRNGDPYLRPSLALVEESLHAVTRERKRVLSQMVTWSLQALRIIILAIEKELVSWKTQKAAKDKERARFNKDKFGQVVALAKGLDKWGVDLGMPVQLRQLHIDLEAFRKRAGGIPH
jgi:hypothetical protein